MRKTMLLALVGAVGLWIPAVVVEAEQMGGSLAKIEGSIASVNLKAQPPTLKLTTEQGGSATFTLDSQATQVRQDGRMAKLEDLKAGQRVQVEQASKNGQQMAKTIEVVSPGSAAPQAQSGASSAPRAPGAAGASPRGTETPNEPRSGP